MEWSRDFYLTIDGEYEPTPYKSYTLDVRRGKLNHSYQGRIRQRDDKGYFAYAHLCIGNHPIQKIIEGDKEGSYFRTLKQAKDFVNNHIRNFDKSYEPNDMIETWKYSHCKPVFDKDLKYVGDEYFSANYVTNERSRDIWDYFNSNPIHYDGLYLTLELKDNKLLLYRQTCYPIMTGGEYIQNDSLKENLLDKVCKLNNPYLERYKNIRVC